MGPKVSQSISLRETSRAETVSILSADRAIRSSPFSFIFWIRQTVCLSARVYVNSHIHRLRATRVCSSDNRCNCIHRFCSLVFRSSLISRITHWAVSHSISTQDFSQRVHSTYFNRFSSNMMSLRMQQKILSREIRRSQRI